jgi:hypothetical protein
MISAYNFVKSPLFLDYWALNKEIDISGGILLVMCFVLNRFSRRSRISGSEGPGWSKWQSRSCRS